MEKRRTSFVYPLVFVAIIFIGFCCCLAIVVSLIPTFIVTETVPKTFSGYTAYQLDDVRFPFDGGDTKDVKVTRRAASLVRPTSGMIVKLEKQFNMAFSSINADVSINDATIDLSTNELVLSLEIRIYSRCIMCSRREKVLIEKTFETNLNMAVPVEYMSDCNASPTIIPARNLRFRKGNYRVSQSFQSLNRKYNASCPVSNNTTPTSRSTSIATSMTTSRALLTDSRGCQEVYPSGVVLSLNPVDNTTYHYLCYFYSPSNSSRTTTITFSLSGNNPDLYTQLDDIQLNSTSGNLVLNGDFEIGNYTNQWYVQSCSSCDPGVDDLYSQSGILAFYASGVGVQLSQNVTIDPASNSNRPFYFSFWLAYECGGNNQCSIQVSLLTF